MTDQQKVNREPGTCIPWEVKRAEMPKLEGDEELVKRVWQDVDALAYVYIWQILLSF